MRIYCRDLTAQLDKVLELPMSEEELMLELKEHEFIILDTEELDGISSYTSILYVNEVLNYCREQQISMKELGVINKASGNFEECLNILQEGYAILNFNEYTKLWYCGSGGNYLNPDDLGLCLFEAGEIALPFDVKEENYDYINWETLWNEAQTSYGWTLICKGDAYLIRI